MSDYFLNTILVVGGSLIGTLLLGSMAAYVLARFDFPGNRFIYFLFIGGMSFPIILALVPLFFVMNNMGLLNTIHGLILVYIAYSLPFTVFFLTVVLPDPADLGGGGGHRRRRLAHPDLLPGDAADGQARSDQRRASSTSSASGTSTCCRRCSTPTRTKRCSPRAWCELAASQGYKGDWSGLFAGLVMAMLPVLAAYIIFQRQVVAGLTAGALK